MSNKNLLQICLSPDLGGLELYMSKCSRQLENDFKLIKVISKNSKLEKYFNNESNVYTIERKNSFSFLTAFKLSKIIDNEQIDLIHLHWTKDIPIIVLAKVFSKRKPKVIQTRHMTMTRFKNDFYHNFLYKNIDMIIAVTKEVENQLNKFISYEVRPKIEQLYIGAECPSKYSKEEIFEYKSSLNMEASFMIGIVGRINEFKGQYLLINAMKELRNKNLNMKAFIVGHPMDEVYLSKLKQDIIDNKLENDIEFLGFTSEPHKFMQACDIILMTSKNETFGLVTIEAMKMGTSVIGSNAGGVLEIIEDNETGLLFENRNSLDLSSKIELLYNNSVLRNRIEKKAEIEANKKFNNVIHFEKLIKIFKKI